MGNLHNEMVKDLIAIEGELGNPSFVWSGNTYTCIANLSQFNRELGEGGFRVQQLLTITVPRFDVTGTPTFPNDILPESQQKITFNGAQFRIENVKSDSVFDFDSSGTSISTGARIRIIAMDTTRGI